MKNNSLTYKDSGVDIAQTDAIKVGIGKMLNTENERVLGKIGDFAALYDIDFGLREPVLVLKSEEPGSKQKLAFKYGLIESICYDMINHLVNDIIVMGAKPLAVLDTIVTASSDEYVINSLVKGMKNACSDNDCALVGGETSIQPGVVSGDVCVLTSTIAGIAEKSKIVDGSRSEAGDAVVAISSNGIHTNGYTLIRMLMDKFPSIIDEKIDGRTFTEIIMTPHRAYQKCIAEALSLGDKITGMAHITGGGIAGNVCRILPEKLCAVIDLSKINVLPIFSLIKKYSGADDNEMLSTFNCGTGMIITCRQEDKEHLLRVFNRYYASYEIGEITYANEKVIFKNNLAW